MDREGNTGSFIISFFIWVLAELFCFYHRLHIVYQSYRKAYSMFQEMIIRITGTKALTIENYKNILDYKENLIVIQGKAENIKIMGNDFRIDYFTHESMRITGTVEHIEFGRTGKKK